tara:strand:+ start:19060 stop:19560 length:501 start_codon:yes stop_codon:yes gene_type:complete
MGCQRAVEQIYLYREPNERRIEEFNIVFGLLFDLALREVKAKISSTGKPSAFDLDTIKPNTSALIKSLERVHLLLPDIQPTGDGIAGEEWLDVLVDFGSMAEGYLGNPLHGHAVRVKQETVWCIHLDASRLKDHEKRASLNNSSTLVTEMKGIIVRFLRSTSGFSL